MPDKIDVSAFWTISYGLYIVSSCNEGKLNGQISNSVIQVTDIPAKLLISINKNELTHDYIKKSRHFGVSVLEQDVPMKLIGLFGFKSGREIDKLSQVNFKDGPSGCPLVTENALAIFETKVIEEIDVGSHTVFIGEVVYAEVLKQGSPITYAYYHEIKKGKSPEYSPVSKLKIDTPVKEKFEDDKLITERSKNMKKYVCNVCGYIYNPEEGDPEGGVEPGTSFEELPDSWECPICGVGKDEFSPA